MLPSLLSWAAAAPQVTTEIANEGPLRRRLVSDDADVVLLVASEQEGIVGPCGCSIEPLGGLDRMASVVRSMRRRTPNTPILTLNVGGLLASTSRDTDAAMVQASPFDGLLATAAERPGVEATPDLPWLSANLDFLPAFRTFSAGDHTVGVTGVTGPDAVAAVRRVLPQLAKVDLRVVLAHRVGTQVPELLALPGVDVVVEAGGFRARYGPYTDEDSVWVRSWQATPVLGELRLWLDEEGIERAVYRWVRLDAKLD
ncbi:MAG: hypothetical protein AAGA48_11665 [Myxococcota bacterium]